MPKRTRRLAASQSFTEDEVQHLERALIHIASPETTSLARKVASMRRSIDRQKKQRALGEAYGSSGTSGFVEQTDPEGGV